MLKKLRVKFVVINMVIVAVMLMVIFFLVYQFTAANLENETNAALQSLAQSAGQPAMPGERGAATQLPYFTLHISNWGQVTASGNAGFDLDDTEFLQQMLNTVFNSEDIYGSIPEYDLRYYRASSPGGQTIAFVDVSSQRAVLRMLVQISILVEILGIGGFLGISFLLARWAVKPVEKAWEQQRQFVSDASHELKTPLTVIMSNAELLQSPDCDPESRNRFAGNILTMSGHMRRLVEGLLELARADNGQVKKSFGPVDMSRLLSDGLLPFEPAYFEQGLTLCSRIEPGITLVGSAQYLNQVVDILLENALKYSDPGAVTVQLMRQGRGHCLLTVANPGTPIAPEAREKIFQRFYRADQARSRNGSFGLGLSIAKSVVTEHGGKIWVEANETGNCFCVQLPTQ